MNIIEFLSYAFIQKALIAGSLIAVITAVLGVFLVLKRLSLIGDSLSHVALSGIALGLITHTNPVFMAIPVVMLSSLGIYKIGAKAKVHSDGALGIIAAAGISLGLILAALAGGFNVDLLSFLFGSILTVNTAELALAALLAVIILTLVYFFYNDLIAVAFDENFAKTAGVNTERINIILVLISAAAVVIALKVVGIMLVSAMIIIPPTAALQLAKTFRRALILASIFSIAGVVLGIYAAFIFNMPAGAMIILTDIFFLFITIILRTYASKKRRIAKAD